MRLRRAGAADARKLALVGCATFLESFANDHDGDEVADYLFADQTPAYYEATFANPATAAWLVEEARGCPVGYAMLIAASLPGAQTGDVELKRIYMLSKWLRQGFGAQLYQAVEDEARARGAARLVLSVYDKNLPAQRFYQARGFEQIGQWLFKGFDTSEDFIYAKRL